MAYSLNDMILKPIEAVIAGAYSHGRNVFYEHEVYAVLSIFGHRLMKTSGIFSEWLK
jgi:hypothetical protein